MFLPLRQPFSDPTSLHPGTENQTPHSMLHNCKTDVCYRNIDERESQSRTSTYILALFSGQLSRWPQISVRVHATIHWTCWQSMDFDTSKFYANATLCPMPSQIYLNFVPLHKTFCRCTGPSSAIFSCEVKLECLCVNSEHNTHGKWCSHI